MQDLPVCPARAGRLARHSGEAEVRGDVNMSEVGSGPRSYEEHREMEK